jgi:plasmid maintenance system antidote protein VapI
MPMKNPPHPGHSIKDACIDASGLNVTQGAAVLGAARHKLSRVLNGQAGISPEWPSGWKRQVGRTPGSVRTRSK